MKLTPRELEAVVNLENVPDYKVLYEALDTYRHELLEFTMYGGEDLVHTYRGMARGVTEVMRALTTARQRLQDAQLKGDRHGHSSPASH